MTNRGAIVLDTNVLISALILESSIAGRVVYTALLNSEVLFSLETWQELLATLARRKFDKYLQAGVRERFIAALKPKAFVTISTRIHVCRDPRDNKFLELAIDGDASHIITGDRDLLALGLFRGIQIISPREFTC